MLSNSEEGTLPMKRILASALLVGISSFGLVGCDQKSEEKVEKTVTTPGGTDKVTTTVEDKKTGDMKEPGAGTAPATPPATEPKP